MQPVFRNLLILVISFFTCIANGTIMDDIVGDARVRNEKKALVEWVMENAHYKTGKFAMTPDKAAKIVENAYFNGAVEGVDPLLVLAVAKTESGFRSNISSNAGAKGMMQVIPKYHKEKLQSRDPYRVSVSIEVGTKIIKEYLSASNNNTRKALDKYSGGAKQYYTKVSRTHKSISKHLVEYAFANELPIYAVHSIEKPIINKERQIVMVAAR